MTIAGAATLPKAPTATEVERFKLQSDVNDSISESHRKPDFTSGHRFVGGALGFLGVGAAAFGIANLLESRMPAGDPWSMSGIGGAIVGGMVMLACVVGVAVAGGYAGNALGEHFGKKMTADKLAKHNENAQKEVDAFQSKLDKAGGALSPTRFDEVRTYTNAFPELINGENPFN